MTALIYDLQRRERCTQREESPTSRMVWLTWWWVDFGAWGRGEGASSSRPRRNQPSKESPR